MGLLFPSPTPRVSEQKAEESRLGARKRLPSSSLSQMSQIMSSISPSFAMLKRASRTIKFKRRSSDSIDFRVDFEFLNGESGNFSSSCSSSHSSDNKRLSQRHRAFAVTITLVFVTASGGRIGAKSLSARFLHRHMPGAVYGRQVWLIEII
jgi:hypothetical protein